MNAKSKMDQINSDFQPGAVKPKKHSKESKLKIKNTGKSQKVKTMKMPKDVYDNLNIIKNLDEKQYNYVTLQMLIDFYLEHSSSDYKKRFNILKN
ncbi:hypothetical protein [Apilactobacillus timberlakei]|uniref:Replication-associated protein RepC n=1 Tax=Apilactobacillus timberlakei TaxID=2008380 RepID=A0ABY2YV97_9LACO|nr:hypothetical protein [Apilactobacillus timberlakei]TPR12413.1 hypothetical protein DY048_07635 [Apilactobacillus timberlakei]TPR12953.1 hypothetical protein DY052_08555 [Apilactobacillus timberlakei]